MADYKIRIVVEGEDRASGPLSGATGSLQRMGEIAGGIGIARIFDAAADGAARLGSAMVGMIANAGGLESQIDAIGAISGASAEEMAGLAGLINDLGINPNLKVSTYEAADAIGNLVANGLTLDQVFAGAAEQTVLLANATGADFGTAADIATDSMSLFNIGAAEMSTAVDGIAGVVAASKFDIYDYQMALAAGGGVAALAGVSFKDFNTSLTAVSSSFASGSDAGTSMKTMFQRLVPQSKEAASAMAELGLEFFNADGSMKDMADIAGELNGAFAGLSEVQRINYMSTIFGTDAMRAAGELANYTAEEYRALQQQIGRTDAMAAAEVRLDNLTGDWEVFGGMLEAVGLQVGAAFQEPARAAVQGLTQLVSTATPLLLQWADQAAAFVTPYVEGVVTTLTDPAWQADVSSQVTAFWDNYTQNNRIAFNLGDMLEVDFSLDGAGEGITKFKLSDFFEFYSEDGAIEKIHLDQVIDFTQAEGKTKLSIFDVFDFESTEGGPVQWNVKDLVSFEGISDEEFTLTIGGFEYTSKPEGDYTVTGWTYNEQPIGEVISAETTAGLVALGGYFDGFAVAVDALTGWEMPKPSEFADEMNKSFGLLGGYFSGFGAAADKLSGFKLPEMPTFKWPTMPTLKWPPLPTLKWPTMPTFAWPALPTWSWPTMPAFAWPALPSFSWPKMPTFAWPTLPTWSWPTMPAFAWPALPTWSWPSFPRFSWPSFPKFSWPSFSWPPLPWQSSPPAATGGLRSGLTWVGEFGPELVNLPGGSWVNTAGQSRQMAAGMGTQIVNVAATINTPLDVEELTRKIADRLKRRGW